ncbi:hypothetical protein DPMN_029894 [Dreissena polymorpha]|uniref:Uncharacterized protein n=1 Tax=Dreissena polymorpha TaxID=45954 RepID=A0A9D4LZ00_DREPO|nr:hypothetical protein DPMN_029894 [Dreissena polymorpha]
MSGDSKMSWTYLRGKKGLMESYVQMAISSRVYFMLLMPPCVFISTAIACPREGTGHSTYDVNIDSSSSSSLYLLASATTCWTTALELCSFSG